MKNEFKNALDGIRTMMTVEIQSLIERGGSNNDDVIKLFRERLKIQISIFGQAASAVGRQAANQAEYEAIMLRKLDELLKIMRSPRPDFVRDGFYVSPAKPTNRLFFWAYQDLYGLCTRIRISIRRRTPTDLPWDYLNFVQLEFDELTTDTDVLNARGISKNLGTALMQPFHSIREGDFFDLTYTDLEKLRRLKKAIRDCHEQHKDDLEEDLHLLLHKFEVNTKEAIIYCKDRLKKKLDNAETDDESLKVLALEEKTLRQITMESITKFDHYRDPLREEILRYIDAEYTCRAKLPEPSARTDAAVIIVPDGQAVLKLAVTNEHHAAHMRLMEETGYFYEEKKDVVEKTGDMVVSNRNKEIALKAYRKNFYSPTAKAIMSVWIMLMKQVAWMMCIFGPQQYGIPDLETTDPKEIKEYLLSFTKSFKHKK